MILAKSSPLKIPLFLSSPNDANRQIPFPLNEAEVPSRRFADPENTADAITWQQSKHAGEKVRVHRQNLRLPLSPLRLASCDLLSTAISISQIMSITARPS
jgi:hypothetical protein